MPIQSQLRTLSTCRQSTLPPAAASSAVCCQDTQSGQLVQVIDEAGEVATSWPPTANRNDRASSRPRSGSHEQVRPGHLDQFVRSYRAEARAQHHIPTTSWKKAHRAWKLPPRSPFAPPTADAGLTVQIGRPEPTMATGPHVELQKKKKRRIRVCECIFARVVPHSRAKGSGDADDLLAAPVRSLGVLFPSGVRSHSYHIGAVRGILRRWLAGYSAFQCDS